MPRIYPKQGNKIAAVRIRVFRPEIGVLGPTNFPSRGILVMIAVDLGKAPPSAHKPEVTTRVTTSSQDPERRGKAGVAGDYLPRDSWAY